jgi:mRNA degradation ribonuclease J1/J2
MERYLEWIGTGAGLNPTLGNTSFLIKAEERTLLVDCGFSVPVELIKKGKLKEITDVVITHTHSDHIGGLEGLAFMNYFAFNRREENRPNLYLPSEEFAKNLWENSLKGGLEKIQDDNNKPVTAKLDTYFKVKITKDIEIPNMPAAHLFSAPHVQDMENYGVKLDNGIFYSGDSLNLPPTNEKIIFQDCQFYETKTDVHIVYSRLKKDLSAEVKAKTYLVHLSGGYDKINAQEDGFAGLVKPGDRFYF